MARDSRTQAEVHQNQVVGQAGIQGQAYREGNLEAGSLAEVLACQAAPDRSRQGDLTIGYKRFSNKSPI